MLVLVELVVDDSAGVDGVEGDAVEGERCTEALHGLGEGVVAEGGDVGKEPSRAADDDWRGVAAEPDEVLAAGERGEIAGELAHGDAAPERRGEFRGLAGLLGVSLAFDRPAKDLGIGGEILDELQSVVVEIEDADGWAGSDLLDVGGDFVARVGSVAEGKVASVEDEDGDGGVVYGRGVIGEGVGREDGFGRGRPSRRRRAR